MICDGCGSKGRKKEITHMPHCPVAYGQPTPYLRVQAAVKLKESVKVLTDAICDGRQTPVDIATALFFASLAFDDVRSALAEEMNGVRIVEG